MEEDDWKVVTKENAPKKRPARGHKVEEKGKQSKRNQSVRDKQFKDKKPTNSRKRTAAGAKGTLEEIPKEKDSSETHEVNNLESSKEENDHVNSLEASNTEQKPNNNRIIAWGSGESPKLLFQNFVNSTNEETSNGSKADNLEIAQTADPTNYRFCSLLRNFSELKNMYAVHKSKGLKNTGCACYRNVVLQALFGLPLFFSLTEYLIENVGEKSIVAGDLGTTPECNTTWSEMLNLALNFYDSLRMHLPVITATETLNKKRQNITMMNNAITADLYIPTLIERFQKHIGATTNDEQKARRRRKPKNSATYDEEGIAREIGTLSLNEGSAEEQQLTETVTATYHDSLQDLTTKKGSQQDAMEFFTFLLDHLHEEIVTLEMQLRQSDEQTPPLPDYALLGNQDFNAAAGGIGKTEADDGWNTVKAKQRVHRYGGGRNKFINYDIDEQSRKSVEEQLHSSIIAVLFHGSLRSEVYYRQKKVTSVTFQKFHCLTLSIQDNEPVPTRNNNHQNGSALRSITLQETLDKYFLEENLDDVQIQKVIKIDRLPPVLILQIARFSFDFFRNIPIKVHRDLIYPKVLQLPRKYFQSNYDASEEIGFESEILAEYELHGVICHHGQKATGGHYLAYTRGLANDNMNGTDSSWRMLNDHKVSHLTEEQALSANKTAYILIYCRRF